MEYARKQLPKLVLGFCFLEQGIYYLFYFSDFCIIAKLLSIYIIYDEYEYTVAFCFPLNIKKIAAFGRPLQLLVLEHKTVFRLR